MTEHENLISVPPDGGWGWVIVSVSFYAMVVIDVPSLGFQIVEDELMDLLSLSAAEVSVFFSTYTMCMFLMGPVAGGVCNRFGFRMTNILGCCLMIIGLGSSYFVSGYFEFLLLYGMMAGMIVILLFGSLLLAPPPMVELESSKPLVGPTQAVDISKITSIVPLEYDKTRVQKLSSKKVYRMSLATGIPVGRVSRPSVTPAPTPIGMGKLFRCCLCCQRCQQSVGSRPLYRKDIFYEGSVYYPAIKNQQNGTTLPLTMTKLPTTNDVKQEVECHCAIPEAVTRAMREMLDWSLLRSPIFLLILASSIVVYMVRYIPFLVLKKYNLPYMDVAAAARTVTMMGLGSLIARASIGFILYFFHNISPLAATIFVTLTGGAIFCCLTLSHKVIYQTALAFLAAALTSVVITLRSLIIIDLLGLNKLTSCTGILFFLQGFASFVGMPIAEILNAKTGSHGVGIIFSGCGYVLSGLFNMCLAIVSVRIKKKQAQRT
nr:monocarboxylate transporter 12-like isoform X2 [Halyomorpha halys]